MSDELSHVAYASLIAGIGGLVANFGSERRTRALRMTLVAIAFMPALAVVALMMSGNPSAAMILIFALLAGMPILAVMMAGKGSAFRIGRKSATLIGLPIAIALACALTSFSARNLEKDRKIAAWHQAEARLKVCAETLTDKEGIADARANHARGDRRLYAITSYSQEESKTFVPGIETRESGFSGPYGFVTGVCLR